MPSRSDFVKSGQNWSPPTADLHNSWTEAALRVLGNRSGPLSRAEFIPLASRLPVDAVSTTARDAMTPVSLSLPKLVPSTRQEAFEPIIMTASDPLPGKPWGVVAEGLPANEPGPVITHGYVWVEAKIRDSKHNYLEVATDGTLQSSYQGRAEIVTPPDGAGGEQLMVPSSHTTGWTLANLGIWNQTERLFGAVTQEEITPLAGGLVLGGEGEVNAELLHAHGGEAISQGKSIMYVLQTNGDRIIIASECESLSAPISDAPAVPSSPTPANGASGVSASPANLEWVSDGNTWDVFFGTPGNIQRVSQNQISRIFSPGNLPAGNYAWFVVARNNVGETQSPYWNFSV